MRRGFSLIELLVSIAIIGVLLGLVLPSLAAARDSARSVVCASNLRQLTLAWVAYAGDFDDRAMPLAYFEPPQTRGGDSIYWFGSDGSVTGRVDYGRGLLTPYLSMQPGERSVYECPEQPWGTYAPQTRTGQVTTTYGYNGYYLSPRQTPGWGGSFGAIRDRPWQRLSTILRPSSVMVFADTLLPLGRGARSTALLDPPQLFDGRGGWSENATPTTAFRHAGRANSARADGSGDSSVHDPAAVFNERDAVGSVSAGLSPAYVPDFASW